MPSGVYMYSPFIPSWFLPLYQEGKGELYNTIGVGLSALYQRCTLKDDISYLLPT